MDDGIVKIIFVKSGDNESNILTKNLSAELHYEHSKNVVGEKLKGRVLEICFNIKYSVQEYFKNQRKSNMTAGRDSQLSQLSDKLTVR